ncbi:MAG: cysteine desulfurase / selenocysteine [Planctomycetota bacterium]|nr:MAG: cysteine desulfurase / selenocysteine [Planctomycetota bacterium]
MASFGGVAVFNARMPLNPARVRADFPILQQRVRGKPLVYLDSAATSQKPEVVIEAMARFYRESNANVHRGAYKLSEDATAMFEGTREKVARFIGAPSAEGVVYVRNTTEAVNLVAHGWGRKFLKAGDEVLLTEMEHHSNLVPWHLLKRDRGIVLKHIPINDEGRLDLSRLDELCTMKTKLVALCHASNVLGTINPVAELAAKAHAVGALFLVDGAQAAPHMKVDVGSLGCDFYAFSAHKMCGPTGVGVLWTRPEILREMDPFMVGGETILEVFLDHSTFRDPPHRFEPGTPAVAEVAGLGSAIDYIESLGLDSIHSHEESLAAYAQQKLAAIPGCVLFGPRSGPRGGVACFNLEPIHPHDLATCLDQDGVCVRAGHHCAQPLMRRLGVVATARASFYVYTSTSDIDLMVESLNRTREFFGCR